MKTTALQSVSNSKNFQYHVDYRFQATEDSESLKTWEEENEEYASWNMDWNEQELASC